MPELAPDPTQLSRLELLQLAQSLGVSDADVMTRAELRAAIDKARRPEPPRVEQYPITWVSVARRLLASVVERGLNLPDAASLIRGDTKLTTPPKAPPPVATVTLARIYGAQGHVQRAVATLDEVLESDPDHELARDLRNQLEQRRIELLARAAGNEPAEVMDAPVDDDGFGDALPDAGVGELLRAGEIAIAEGAADSGKASNETRDVAVVAAQTGPNGASAAFDAATPAELDGAADADLRGNPEGSMQASAEPAQAWIPESAATNLPPADAGRVPEAEAAAAGESGPQPIEPRDVAAELPTAVPPSEPSLMADGQHEVEALPSATADSATASQVDNPEIVAPTFDTVERSGSAETITEPPPAFVTESPTMVGSFESLLADPGDALTPSVAVEPDEDLDTEPPATIASDVELPSDDASLEPPPLEPPPIVPTPLGGMAAAEPSLGEALAGAEGAISAAPIDAPRVAPALGGGEAALAAGSDEPVHAPNGVARAATAGPALPNAAAETGATREAAALLPRVPGLVLIETGTPVRYVYWELADANLGAPHWIHVVSHTPTARGDTERHERRFPVHRRLGVLRLEGVPARAVLRARLTGTSDSRPLVVAGAVRPREAGPFEIRFSPHPNAKPDALATRAQPLLERASPVYWDG
jgi:hypothetical protein